MRRNEGSSQHREESLPVNNLALFVFAERTDNNRCSHGSYDTTLSSTFGGMARNTCTSWHHVRPFPTLEHRS
jgi:hypothetical protein